MKEKVLVFLLYCLLAIIITWPLALHGNTLVIDPTDGILNTWMLNWVAHSLTTGLSGLTNFYNANIFYPYTNTFAYSDLQLPLGILAIPFILLTHEPLWANNGVLLLNLILTAFAVFLLVKHLTKKTEVSVLAGVIFSYSTLHLNYLAHQQSLSVWAVILATLFLLQKHQKLFVFFFVTAVLITPLNLYFLLLIVGVYLFFHRQDFWTVVKSTVVGALIAAPFLIPFWIVSASFHYKRPITDAINNSLQFPDLLNVSIFSRLSNIVPHQPGTPAYLGAAFLTMVILAFRKIKTSMWWWIAGVSLVLALGPALHIYRNTIHVGPIPAIPLPYAIFYYLVPGFAGFRTPSRWIILTALALCVAISVYFAKGITWKWAIALSLLVILEANIPFKYHQVPSVSQFPPEQVWLRDHYLGAPIIQFPIYGWWDNPGVGTETLREYYSTIHFHPMVNGYSGYSPTEWENRVKWLQQNFPNGETVGYLRNLGVKLILMPSDWDVTPVQNELELVASFPQTTIYALNSRFDQK